MKFFVRLWVAFQNLVIDIFNYLFGDGFLLFCCRVFLTISMIFFSTVMIIILKEIFVLI